MMNNRCRRLSKSVSNELSFGDYRDSKTVNMLPSFSQGGFVLLWEFFKSWLGGKGHHIKQNGYTCGYLDLNTFQMLGFSQKIIFYIESYKN